MVVLYLLSLLAWPLVTLVYPLYASIRSIESNSHTDNRKWLSYWILCGLIMLFEHASARLIEWIPFWPYIKLLVTVWLVVPHFDGAVYAYDNLVRPCFSVDPHTLGYWLSPKQDESRVGNSDDFLLHAERYVHENGPAALEKLLFGKVKCVESNPTAENDSVVSVNNKETEALKGIKGSSLARIDYEATATESKATTVLGIVGGDPELPQSSVPNQAQKEWTCALCQVCAHSEIDLQSHLQGKKHKAKEKELMEKQMAAKSSIPCASKFKNPDKHMVTPLKHVSASVPSGRYVNKPEDKRAGRTGKPMVTPTEYVSASGPNGKYVKKPEEDRVGRTGTAPNSKNPYKSLATPKKHVSTSILGKYVNKHEEKRVRGIGTAYQSVRTDQNNTESFTELSALWCHNCELQCNSLSMLTDHLRGKRHLACLLEGTYGGTV